MRYNIPARDITSSSGQCKASATNLTASFLPNGWRWICQTGTSSSNISLRAAFNSWSSPTSLSRYAPIMSKCPISALLHTCFRSSKEAVSAHCRSSRNITRGVSLVANALIKFSNTIKKRFCASFGLKVSAGGC